MSQESENLTCVGPIGEFEQVLYSIVIILYIKCLGCKLYPIGTVDGTARLGRCDFE